MAKKAASKKGVSKSQAIRDHMAAHPEDGPNAVAESLRKSGVVVSAAFVSTVKSMDKKRTQRNGEDGEISMAKLLKAKELAQEMGGVERAREALDALSQLVD